MNIRKVIIFMLFISFIFFGVNFKVNSIAAMDSTPGISIYINIESNDDIVLDDIHVELMVLKSDFNLEQRLSSISDVYKNYYPNYESYTHLENDDEMSYLAFVKGTSITKHQTTLHYENEYGAEHSIQYLRLIMFSTDGNILATSELFFHDGPNLDEHYFFNYEIDYENLTFIQLEPEEHVNIFVALFVLLRVAAVAFLLVLMGILIWLSKTGLSSLLEIRYKKPVMTMILDGIYIILSIFAIYIPYFKRLYSSEFYAILWVTLIFLVWNLVNFFFFAQKETRKKYWVILLVTQIISFVFIWIIVM